LVSASPDWPAPRAADRSDLERIRHAFVQAAGRALRAGFDLVEAHCAHGYLLHEFLSPLSNRRTDDYGGSLDNRMRFPLDVLRALRAAWPSDKPLGMRISGSDWIPGGFDPDEAVRFVAAAKAEGVDYVCVSSGGAAPESAPPGGPAAQIGLAEKVRAETGMVTRAVGGITEAHQAEAILAKGQADFVALARAFLNDPRWVWHAADALGMPTLALVPPQYARAHPGTSMSAPKRAAA
jgi:2,4-dienoyl-CoA reductase-like NADH-dependent reductase (Old Yellow Enzyme family)